MPIRQPARAADSSPNPRTDSLVRAFDRLLDRAPATPLLVSPSRRASAADVDALARAAAGALGGAVAPGTAVGLQSPNGPGFLAALLALRRAGLPALLLDRGTPTAERRRVAAQLGAAGVLVCRCGWAGGGDDFQFEAAGSGGAAGAITPPPAGTAVIKLSSGSTGDARGIPTGDAALVADDRGLTASMGLGPDDRFLATVPFSHSYGLSSLVVPALVRGATLVLPDGDGPFAPLAAAADGAATVFPTVPAYLSALVRLAEPPPLPPSLRLVISAGAPLAPGVSAAFRRRFGRDVHPFYGASEVGGICYDRRGGAAERGTVGTPVEGVGVELEPVEGTDGERVVVRSPAAALDLPGGRFVTRDLGRWRDGELMLLGRLDDLINVKGKKVNPREVERVLAALPGVEEAAVLDAAADGARPRVRAVVACPAGSLDPSRVLAHCRAHLAEHKVPRSVVLVERLPRTERGKLDRAALRRLAPRERSA